MKMLRSAAMALLAALACGCQANAPGGEFKGGDTFARDVQAVQNLMSRRAFLHSIGRNELELDLWAKDHEVRWAQNQGCWVGMDSLKVYYADINQQMQANELKRLNGLNPAIKDIPENRNIGNTVLHLLTTPIIEVAEDGQSAKGVWYTPGAILTTKDGSSVEGMWMWERYGGDFIKEDGKWRIWRLQVFTDFAMPFGEAYTPIGDPATMGTEGGAQAGPGPGAAGLTVPGPDLPKRLYTEFSATRVPVLEPKLPEPYRTMSETFEYADCR